MSIAPVKLGKYTGVMAHAPAEAVAAEEEIEEVLRDMAAEQSWLEPVERPAQIGDQVTIDFYGTVFGEPFEDGQAENFVLELGKEELLDGFDGQIAGMMPGEEKEVRITFPGDLTPDIAGKPAVFRVKLHEVKTLCQPGIDDEWAEDLGYEDLEALKDEVREDILEEKQAEVYQQYIDEMLDRIVGRCEVSVPEDMAAQRAELLIDEFIDELEDGGITDWEQYVIDNGSSPEYMEEVYFPEIAETELKREFVLDAIAATEGITAGEEDIEDFDGLPLEDIVRQKTLQFLIEHAV